MKLEERNNIEKEMYTGLPVSIFLGSDIEECLSEELFEKRKKHYKFMDKKFGEDIKDVSELDKENPLFYYKMSLENGDPKEIISKGLDDMDPRLVLDICLTIDELDQDSKEKVISLLPEYIDTKLRFADTREANILLDIVAYVEPNERYNLLKLALTMNDIHRQSRAVSMIDLVPIEQQPDLWERAIFIIEYGLKSYLVDTALTSAEMSQYLPKNHKSDLQDSIYDALYKIMYSYGCNDIDRVSRITTYLESTHRKKLSNILFETIKGGINNSRYIDPLHQSASSIQYLSSEERIQLENIIYDKIHASIADKDYILSLGLLGYLPKELQESLCEKCTLELDLEHYSLPYSQSNDKINQENYSHSEYHDLQKSNHELYSYQGKDSKKYSSNYAIIDTGAYFGKAYQRTMPLSRFLYRKKTRESYEIWRKKGFDYVPIEPILSFKLLSNKKYPSVKVVSKILHTSLQSFLKSDRIESYKRGRELEQKKKQILEGMKSIGVCHEDVMGGNNFCVQFSYTQDGKIDLEKCPRLYLIDRDRVYYKR